MLLPFIKKCKEKKNNLSRFPFEMEWEIDRFQKKKDASRRG
jgi:hypothetical protein